MIKKFSSIAFFPIMRSMLAGVVLCAFLLMQAAETLHAHSEATHNETTTHRLSSSGESQDFTHDCPLCNNISAKQSLAESFVLHHISIILSLQYSIVTPSLHSFTIIIAQSRAPPAVV